MRGMPDAVPAHVAERHHQLYHELIDFGGLTPAEAHARALHVVLGYCPDPRVTRIDRWDEPAGGYGRDCGRDFVRRAAS